MKAATLLVLSLLPAGAAVAAPPAVRAVSVVERMPHSYVVYGYGTDRQGNGPYLDYNGNALPIGGAPRTIKIKALKAHGLSTEGSIAWKFTVPVMRRAGK